MKIDMIGTDAEGFLFQGNIPVPVVGLLGGTKEQPIPVENGAYQEDNCAAEFNIDPAKTYEDFQKNIHHMVNVLKDKLSPYEVRFVPHVDFDEMALMEVAPQSLTFGCDADMNAWTGMRNRPPSPNVTMRTAAAHVHVSWDKALYNVPLARAARAFDFFLGVPSIVLDNDRKRRKMYGRAGAFRPKPYGIEYRVLSNFWINKPDLIEWVFNNTVQALENHGVVESWSKIYPNTQHVINNYDIEQAKRMIQNLRIQMP